MAHMYWGACCPTDGCRRFERVTYIGKVSPAGRFTLPIDPGDQFSAHCPDCGSDHTYKAASFVPIQRDQPPEDGFEPWF